MTKSLTNSLKLSSKQWLIILASNILAYCCLIMPGINVPEILTFDDNQPTFLAGCF